MLNTSHLLVAVLGVTCVALFVATSLYYLAFYHVSPLSRDQWHMYASYFEQGLWKSMLTPMSTHRHFFPFILFHLDMQWFHGLNHLLILLGLLFNTGVTFILVRDIWQEKIFTPIEKISLGIFVAAQMYWLLNIAQLGWGFMSSQYYLTILMLLLAVKNAFLIRYEKRPPVKNLAVILCFALIATFSFGMGVLIWPILIFFFWIWKSDLRIHIPILSGLAVSIFIFLALPGGDSIQASIALSPIKSLTFVSQLPGGPVFHLIKSWRLVDPELLKPFAATVGTLATVAGIGLLISIFLKRSETTAVEISCYTLMLTGFGSALLISWTRSDFFLDPWVDRYQIWATLYWTGLIPLLVYKLKVRRPDRIVSGAILAVVFPLVAFPSQLDLGSRLYEYKVRVQEALVSFQVGLADQAAAKDALHWNWEHKLPFFFYVLDQIRLHNKNVFYGSPAYMLGSPATEDRGVYVLANDMVFKKEIPIYSKDLIDADSYPVLRDLRDKWIFLDKSTLDTVVGYRVTGHLSYPEPWQFAFGVNSEGVVTGLGIHVEHPSLGRPTSAVAQKTYNFYAVTRGERPSALHWYLYQGKGAPDSPQRDQVNSR